jgi:peptidoglycan/xylan/chitin deacetylase (PgdA/CDA1 family)
MRHCRAVLLVLLAVFAIAGCGKVKNPFAKKDGAPAAEPAAAGKATPAGAEATPEPRPALNPLPPETAQAGATAAGAASEAGLAQPTGGGDSQVVVLCYHRLEGKVGGALSIEPALFEKHLQEIKDRGLAVISMNDFLAWRRGEKEIPPKSVLITIDDGYVSGLTEGVPRLKKFGYAATFYIYTNYVNVGGKSMTWAQLAQVRDEGFDIGCHTISHLDLRKKPAKTQFADYEAWLKNELEASRQILEEQLGIRVTTLAYPFGLHSPKVHEAVKAAGYEAAFSTYGQRIGRNVAPFSIGRYDVTARDAQGNDGFTAAISFQGPAAASAASPVLAQEAQALMVTQPANGAVIHEAKPSLRANLASLGAIEPGSIEMRVSGFGLVPAEYDPASKNIAYTFQQPLRPGQVTVIIGGKSGGRKVETRWSFRYDPNAPSAQDPTDPGQLPPRR